MNKKWQICETDKEKVDELKSKYNISELLATILVNKKFNNAKGNKRIFESNKKRFF